jgi:hypothetical protein
MVRAVRVNLRLVASHGAHESKDFFHRSMIYKVKDPVPFRVGVSHENKLISSRVLAIRRLYPGTYREAYRPER